MRDVLRALRGWPALALVLAVLGLMSLGWNLLAWPLRALLPAARGQAIGRRAIGFIYGTAWSLARRLGLLQLDSGALDALADEPGLVVVANHPTMMDALVLVARLPRAACVMKASLDANPFLGAGARLARYVRNDTVHGMVRQAVADLKAGGQLVMFPEGTRTSHQPLEPFKPGFALIARQAGAPIQTVFIDVDPPYLGKGWPLARLPRFPVRMSVRLGERFTAEGRLPALVDRIERYMAQQVRPLAPAAGSTP